MDTRFWGPPAWKLLHTLGASYDPSKQRAAMANFLELLPYVLPCKFCRANLTAHYEEYPPALASQSAFERWLYDLHGAVSTTLKAQGQTVAAAPTFAHVKDYYSTLVPTPVAPTPFPAWDFLYAVAHTHPLALEETPIPEAPTCQGACDREKNRWNKLSPTRRFHYWQQFWKVLPAVLPPYWAAAWEQATEVAGSYNPKSRRSVVAWLWRVRCTIEGDKDDPYADVCGRLTYYSSGCSTAASARTKTCRRSVVGTRKVKHKPQTK
jgi:hypothetical protein